MRHTVVAACTLALALASRTVSAADGVSADILLSGNVDPTCTIGTFAVDGSATNAVFSPPDQITIATPTDDSAVARPFEITLSADAMCNFTHGLKLASTKGGIRREPFVSVSGFANEVDYIAVLTFPTGVTFLSLSTVGQTSGVEAVATGKPPANGELRLNVQANASTLPSDPLLAGYYEDTLTVTIGQF